MTVIALAFVAPTMAPLPDIVQLYDVIPLGAVYATPASKASTSKSPVIAHVGNGLTVTVCDLVDIQPFASLTVTVYDEVVVGAKVRLGVAAKPKPQS